MTSPQGRERIRTFLKICAVLWLLTVVSWIAVMSAQQDNERHNHRVRVLYCHQTCSEDSAFTDSLEKLNLRNRLTIPKPFKPHRNMRRVE